MIHCKQVSFTLMNNIIKTLRIAVLIIWAMSIQGSVVAQGDQILDGIGETEMIARYVFDGHVKDWSRNTLHATTKGTVRFVNESRFGQVLSLAGDGQSYVVVPNEALRDLEALSVTGWIYLRSETSGQCFIDFGQRDDSHFVIAPRGISEKTALEVVVSSSLDGIYSAVAPPIALNRWVHLAVVLDVATQSLIVYIDGKETVNKTGQLPDLRTVFGENPVEQSRLLIGKSLRNDTLTLDGLLHDVRIYRVPLQADQITRIYAGAGRDRQRIRVNEEKREDQLQPFPLTRAQLYNAYLVAVPEIKVRTVVGELPKLPSYVRGIYRDGLDGPDVRVIWPAPTDNLSVLTPGEYTIIGRIPGSDLRPKAIVKVKAAQKMNKPQLRVEPFRLDEVVLQPDALDRPTKFIENRNKFLSGLASTDPNSFLYMFRHTFGQPQPQGAKPLGVWDSQETKLRGHATGHYLSALAQAYASTGYDTALQTVFLKKMTYVVDVLHELAQLSGRAKEPGGPYVKDPAAVPPGPGKGGYDTDFSVQGIRTDYWNWGEGFISAYPPDQFIMLEQGATYGGQQNQIWAPYYTLHKILAGLMDVYEVSGNEKALEIVRGMSRWVYARLSRLPSDTLISMWNRYIAGEFGGMNEAMARLYRLTGSDEFLKTARLFDNVRLFFGDENRSHGLAKNVDLFRGLHANQHIPQIIGSIELYRVGADLDYFKVADNFWYKVVNDYMYSIGGVAGARNPANAECFTVEPATLYANGFAAGGQNETCATYNMLKLTDNLFRFNPRVEYMDYYERGLYNHILASVAKDSPANTYHVSVRPGAVKQFSNPNMTGFTCCNGTAIESNTKLQQAIYYRSIDDKNLYINLFIPSTLTWSSRNVILEQSTNFPLEDKTRFTIRGGGVFDVHIRIPSWAKAGCFVWINGKRRRVKAEAGSYLHLTRKWNDGDIIEVQMPFQFRLEPVMDQQNVASLFYGPVLLAAQEAGPRSEWRKITLDVNDLGKTIQGDPSKLTFTIDGVEFKPFYETYGRHSVYLDVTLN